MLYVTKEKTKLQTLFNFSTVTSRLFTHIMSTEKLGKEIRDRKDRRGIKHTYYNGSFFYIASS